MGFRKKNSEVIEIKLWRTFSHDNQILIEQIGLPLKVIETREYFDDLLMHGYLDHHDDPTHFAIHELDKARYELFKRLVDIYYAAGYCDPGLMALSPEERNELASKYPKQFSKN